MIRLGIIGLSPGNGHPYSWSAIFNGYNPEEMEACGFPVIPRYLAKQAFPDDQIPDARVTHVWAQDTLRAMHVARASRIETVVDRYDEMIGQVDGVLLARDDGERHCEMAMPFLQAGLPIYIDKPFALSRADALAMLNAQQYPGQLFTCSALRYAKEFQLSESDRTQLGPIRQIHAMTPKGWDCYAAHAIEPALALVPERGEIVRVVSCISGDSTTLKVIYSSGFQLLVTSLGAACAPIALRVMGEQGWKDLIFQDSFHAFKGALQVFVESLRTRAIPISRDSMLEIVRLIEEGRTA